MGFAAKLELQIRKPGIPKNSNNSSVRAAPRVVEKAPNAVRSEWHINFVNIEFPKRVLNGICHSGQRANCSGFTASFHSDGLLRVGTGSEWNERMVYSVARGMA